MNRRLALAVWVILAISVIVSFKIGVHWNRQSPPRNASHIHQNCMKLEPGMTRSEVVAIMGVPNGGGFKRSGGQTMEVWCFDCRSLLSTPYLCEFDSAIGTVVYVSCGEDKDGTRIKGSDRTTVELNVDPR